MSIFKGAAVAMITPMTETQEVNYEKLGELIEEQIAGGTDAIVICGTTGEASTLSHEEHLDAIKYTVEKVNHRIPVIAVSGSNADSSAGFKCVSIFCCCCSLFLMFASFRLSSSSPTLLESDKTIEQERLL